MDQLLSKEKHYAPAISTAAAEMVGVAKYAPPFVDWLTPFNKCCTALAAARVYVKRLMFRHLAGIRLHPPGPEVTLEVMQTSPNIGLHFPPFSSKGCPTVLDFISKNYDLFQDFFLWET